MPRAVWQPTSARMPAPRAVASRVASITTKLTSTSKEKKPRHGSIPRAILVYLCSTLNKGESHEPEGRRFSPIVVFPPKRTRDYGLPFAQPKESQEVTTASLMVRRAGLGVFNRAYLWTPAGKVPVQFLALAVVAKAENNRNCLNSPAVLVRLDHL